MFKGSDIDFRVLDRLLDERKHQNPSIKIYAALRESLAYVAEYKNVVNSTPIFNPIAARASILLCGICQSFQDAALQASEIERNVEHPPVPPETPGGWIITKSKEAAEKLRTTRATQQQRLNKFELAKTKREKALSKGLPATTALAEVMSRSAQTKFEYSRLGGLYRKYEDVIEPNLKELLVLANEKLITPWHEKLYFLADKFERLGNRFFFRVLDFYGRDEPFMVLYFDIRDRRKNDGHLVDAEGVIKRHKSLERMIVMLERLLVNFVDYLARDAQPRITPKVFKDLGLNLYAFEEFFQHHGHRVHMGELFGKSGIMKEQIVCPESVCKYLFGAASASPEFDIEEEELTPESRVVRKVPPSELGPRWLSFYQKFKTDRDEKYGTPWSRLWKSQEVIFVYEIMNARLLKKELEDREVDPSWP